MKKRKILAGISGTCLLALGLGAAQAATYESDLAFSANDQSMWQQGTAGQLVIDEFIGPQWNATGSVGGIAEAKVPSVTVIPEICGWGVCTPAVTTPAVDFGDYGAVAQGSTNGQIGFDLNVQATTGDVDIGYAGTADFAWADGRDLLQNDPVVISTDFAEGATLLATNFPEASLDLDFVFDVYADGSFTACVIDCASLNFPTIDVDLTLDIIDIDTNGATLDADFNFVAISAQLPNLETQDTTPDAAGNLVASGVGDDPLIDLDIDLDLIATTLLGLPQLTQEVGIAGASAGFTLLDVLVGANVQIVQTFVFDPILMVTLDASDGQSVTGAVGSDLTFANGFARGDTTVTPTFWLDNTFRNVTSLRIDPTFDFEVLKANLGMDFPGFINDLGIPDPDLTLGPLFAINATTAGPALDVFDQSWSIPFSRVSGASFTVTTVPEPGTLMLFGIGLLVLGASSRASSRRRRDDRQQLAA